MAADDECKSRKRRDKHKSSAGLPSQIVCTAQDAINHKGSIELGLVFSLVVIGLYLYGFAESIQALPDVATGRLLGTNLNIAKLQPDVIALEASTRRGNAHPDKAVVPANAGKLTVDGVDIPIGKWPVTTRDEENDFEVLLHPGDHRTEMLVPKFWSAPLHNKKLFTRERAMKIGTCVIPDPVTGSQIRGTDCPPDERTIFVAIASYRDFECRSTVESLFTRAKNPHRLRVGAFKRPFPESASRNFLFLISFSRLIVLGGSRCRSNR